MFIVHWNRKYDSQWLRLLKHTFLYFQVLQKSGTFKFQSFWKSLKFMFCFQLLEIQRSYSDLNAYWLYILFLIPSGSKQVAFGDISTQFINIFRHYWVKMGKTLSKIFGKKEIRILMLGLDASGKTSKLIECLFHLMIYVSGILYRLKLGQSIKSIPTVGVSTFWIKGSIEFINFFLLFKF